jgi:DNA-binding CsgD family transcriptional regulator
MAPRTVSWHVGHILAKFDVESRTAAASLAVREGLA